MYLYIQSDLRPKGEGMHQSQQESPKIRKDNVDLHKSTKMQYGF